MINKKFADQISTFNNLNPISSLFSLKDNFNSEVSYKSDCRTFYEKLLEVSKSKGLGENISIQTNYDGNIPEKIFTIHAKNNMLWNFYKDAYIIIK